jgi:hypothetical protein
MLNTKIVVYRMQLVCKSVSIVHVGRSAHNWGGCEFILKKWFDIVYTECVGVDSPPTQIFTKINAIVQFGERIPQHFQGVLKKCVFADFVTIFVVQGVHAKPPSIIDDLFFRN